VQPVAGGAGGQRAFDNGAKGLGPQNRCRSKGYLIRHLAQPAHGLVQIVNKTAKLEGLGDGAP